MRKVVELKLPVVVVEELQKKAKELGLKSASALLKALSLNPQVYCPHLEVKRWEGEKETLFLSYTPEEKERALSNAHRFGVKTIQELIRFLLLTKKNGSICK